MNAETIFSTPLYRLAISFEQGTPEWRRWRRSGIGGSDVPTLLGVGYATHDILLKEKVNGVDRDVNFAMQRGTIMEPEARGHYQRRFGVEVEPVCFERMEPGYEWMRCSLDGWNRSVKFDNFALPISSQLPAGAFSLEIKCPGDDHDIALNGIVPEKYRPQVQWTMLVGSIPLLHYYSYNPSERYSPEQYGALVEVVPDFEYMNFCLLKAVAFWKRVLRLRENF